MASRKVQVGWLLLCVPLLGATALPGEASSERDNRVTQIAVQRGQQATRVVLQAEATPTFTVFKLKNPDRLVVDLLHAGLADEAAKPLAVDDERVGRIATTQFKQAGSLVSRVIIGLKPDVRFDAQAQGKAVVVTIAGKRAVAEAKRSGSGQKERPGEPAARPAGAMRDDRAARADAERKSRSDATGEDFKVVSSFGDRRAARRVNVRRISSGKRDTVTLLTDRQVDAYEVLEVYEPNRLVVDLFAASMKHKHYARKLSGRFVDRLRVGKHADKVRLVLDLAGGKRQAYRIERIERGVRIRFGKQPTERSAVADRPSEPPASKSAERNNGGEPARPVRKAEAVAESRAAPAKAVEPARLQDLTFRQDKRISRVVLDLQGEARPTVVHADARSTVLEIPNCRMPIILQRTLDTSEFGGVIQSLSTYRVQGTDGRDSVKLVAVTSQQAPSRFERREGKLHWVFEATERTPKDVAKATADKKPQVGEYAYAPDQVAGYAVRQPLLAQASGGRRKKAYRGRRITLDFKDADIHNILRLISEVAKLNIITSDDVKGTITITMRNVPWDQALDIILKTKKLGKVRHGNIIRVAPLEELAKEQDLARKAAEAKRTLEPLRVRIIHVNYATASDIVKQVQEVLSERGRVTIDERTNVLIVKDILENLVKAEGIVRSLDTETPQVLIEARIVEANTQYLREVGIQWGGHLDFSAATGNPTGLPFPSNVIAQGGADDTQTIATGTALPGQFAVNLPAAVGAGSGGALGFIFGSAGGAAQLNLRLSALENRGAVKIVSAPKITTLDNKKAKIGQGVSIPISVVSAAGVNTVFVEAKLELEVTPHITQEGSVLLGIRVSKNEPDFSRTGAKGDPTILKKEAETQVLVRDGDTTVIGGIYTRKSSDTYAGVPGLAQIPILGWFFRSTKYNDDRTELLIFITPRIVNRLQATVSRGVSQR